MAADRRGHGDSDPYTSSYRLPDDVDDLVAIVTDLAAEAGEVELVAVSAGCHVALAAAVAGAPPTACCPAAAGDGLIVLLTITVDSRGARLRFIRYVPIWVRHPDFVVLPAGVAWRTDRADAAALRASYERTVAAAGRGPASSRSPPTCYQRPGSPLESSASAPADSARGGPLAPEDGKRNLRSAKLLQVPTPTTTGSSASPGTASPSCYENLCPLHRRPTLQTRALPVLSASTRTGQMSKADTTASGSPPDSSCPSGGLPACPVLGHGEVRPPLTSAAVPVTLPSRVMVFSASAWPSTYRSKKASVTRATRCSTGFVPWYGIRWLAPSRSR